MACISRNLLITNALVGASNPIFGKTAEITIHNLVFVNGRHKLVRVESRSLIRPPLPIENDRVKAMIGKNLLLNFSSRGAILLHFRRDMASVTGKVVLAKFGWGNDLGHIYFYLCY